MEELKTQIYEWFEKEYSLKLQKKQKAKLEESIQQKLNRINWHNHKNYCLEKNLDYEKSKLEQIERVKKECKNVQSIHNIVSICKGHIDGIFNRIKYYSEEQIFEYFVNKRDRELNQNYNSSLLPIFDKFLEIITSLNLTSSSNNNLAKLSIENTKPDESNNIKEYPEHIFTQKGHKLFLYLIDNFVKDYKTKKRGYQKDIIYMYYQMKSKKFIVTTLQPFLDWLQETEPYLIERFQTQRESDSFSEDRKSLYNTCLDLFKQRNPNVL